MAGERDLGLRLGEYAQANSDTPLKLKHARAIVKAVSEAIGEHIQEEVAKLVARIELLEAKPAIEYCGTYAPGRSYTPGNAVTHRGSLWICVETTSVAPSFDDGPPNGWQLAAKRGRDAKDRAA